VQSSSLTTAVSNTPKVKEKLKTIDFIAVHDLYLTPTAELADIVLPAATFFEYPHIHRESYGNPSVDTLTVTLANKVVEPLGECLSDPKFIFELARRVGLKRYFPWRNEEDAINYEIEPLGLTVEELRKHPEGISITYGPEQVYRKYERKGFRTSTGKVEIYSGIFKKHGYNPLPEFKEPAEGLYASQAVSKEYPLVCGTGLKLGEFTNSRFRTLPSLSRVHPDPFVEINPLTAKEIGVKNKDLVFVESPRGQIKIKAKLTRAVHPKVVMITHGWNQICEDGQTDNNLTDDIQRCPISAATGNRSFLCRVYKVQTKKSAKKRKKKILDENKDV
jgi:anaerobic selenocysteine-containing dehydrogenase